MPQGEIDFLQRGFVGKTSDGSAVQIDGYVPIFRSGQGQVVPLSVNYRCLEKRADIGAVVFNPLGREVKRKVSL